MAIDFKGIKIKYVGANAGTAFIDTTMSQINFYKNEPRGIFTCFIFPNKGFAGNDYKSLQSLVFNEATQMWDKTNRNTFLGFNEETKQFVININGYLSAKDPDLKTVGELPHSEQSGWFETEIQTTKDTDSIFEFIQIDGSKAWLKIKPFEIVSGGIPSIYPATAVEYKEKSVLGSTLFKKNNALFAKSIEDNSVLMVNDCVIDYPASSPVNVLSRDNKEYGISTRGSSTYQYGKKIFSFETTTSLNPITFAYTNVCIKNQSTSTEFELTRTSNLEDILASGESLTFFTDTKYKGIQFANADYKDVMNNIDVSVPMGHQYGYDSNGKSYFNIKKITKGSFSLNLDKSIKGIPFEMISCDTRKPFIYSPSSEYLLISGFGLDSYKRQQIDLSNILNKVQPGFIFVIQTNFNSTMIKDGKIFSKRSSAYFTEITGTTQFGNDIYSDKNEAHKFVPLSVSKDDLINEVGFIEWTNSGKTILGTLESSGFLITVLRL